MSNPIQNISSIDFETYNNEVLHSVGLTKEQCATNKVAQKVYQKLLEDQQPINGLEIFGNRFETKIDKIIKNRRDEHASSFGYKYLKDTMDTTESNAVWGACLVPRMLVAPAYAFGKNNGLGGLVYAVNPINWIRGVAGSVAMHGVGISSAARKEQAIRTLVEGFEVKPQRDLGDQTPWYASVYDKNKTYKNGIFEGKFSKTLQAQRGFLAEIDMFNGSAEQKVEFLSQIREMQQEIRELIPDSDKKSWFRAFSNQIDAIEKLPSSINTPHSAG